MQRGTDKKPEVLRGSNEINKKAEKILNATIKLFIRDGVKKVTMDDIAQNSNVSKVTVYKYFEDKDALYLQISKHVFFHYIINLEKIVESCDFFIKKLYAFLDVICDFINSAKLELCEQLAEYNSDIEAEYKHYFLIYKRSMLALIDDGIEKGLIKDTLNKDMIFYYIDMGIAYYKQNPEYRNKMISDNGFQQQIMQFFIGSIFADEKVLTI